MKVTQEHIEEILKALKNNKPVEIPEVENAQDLRTAIMNTLAQSPGQVFIAHPSVGNALRKVKPKEVKE